MKRTFNYTGRRRIGQKDVSVILRQDRRAWMFDIELRLTDYHFPKNAEIWIEAYRQNLWMQWSYGTMSMQRPPSDRRLLEFKEPDGVLFRVRVVQPPGPEHHKLLGEADEISFVKAGEAEDRRQHLLTPVPESLDQLLWKLDTEGEEPRLLVNKDAKPDWKSVARSAAFISLVYPEILRQLLVRAVEEYSEDDDDERWESKWIRFGQHVGGLGSVPERQEDRILWIDEAVSGFTRKHSLRKRWDSAYGDGEDSK